MKKLLLIGTILMGLILTSCGSKPNETNSDKETSNQVTMDKDQSLNVLLGSEPKSLDPSKNTSSGGQILAQMGEPLASVVKDGDKRKMIPAGAESWTVTDEGKTFTFKIRQGMKWEDGVEVDANQYAYGILRTLDPNTGSTYSFLLMPILNAKDYNAGKISADKVGVKALDKYTLQIKLKAPTAYFEQLLRFTKFFPQRKDLIEKYGDKFGSEPETLVSCGPFKVEQWIHNSKIVMVKNPTYYDADRVHLDKVTFSIIKDDNSKMNLLLTNQIDTADVTKPEWIKKFDQTGEFVRRSEYGLSTHYNFYNTTDKLFKNAKVRKAFSLAIDREGINSAVFSGLNEPAYGFVAKGVSIGGVDYHSLTKEPLLADKDVDPKKLLQEGLKELGMSTDLSKLSVSFLAYSTDSSTRKEVEFMQEMYKKNLGVNIVPQFVEWTVYSKMTDNLNYQIAMGNWTNDYNDPNTFLDMWVSNAKIVNTGFNNPEYDKFIDEAGNTANNDKRLEFFKKAENLLVDKEAIVAPIYYRKGNKFSKKYLKDFNPITSVVLVYKDVYISGRE